MEDIKKDIVVFLAGFFTPKTALFVLGAALIIIIIIIVMAVESAIVERKESGYLDLEGEERILLWLKKIIVLIAAAMAAIWILFC